jgi:octaheme c-type cytochrome (tetrathionate reductase family)
VRRIVLFFVLLALTALVVVGGLRSRQVAVTPLEQLQARLARKHVPSVDHSKLPALQQDFAAPRDVTAACLSCHTERGREVLSSSHWNWTRREYIPGRGIHTVGKKNILNNFCIGTSSNLEGCSSCHAGYGLTGDDFDFTDARNIDCLACHDQTGTYAKTRGGMPAPSVNLREVAQHVGRPLRANCGTCHFFGGGGNNVKHGDLEQALFDPPRTLDVHMASDGANLQCVDCHEAENHQMLGKSYALSSMNRGRVTCEQCHTARPHADDLLDAHAIEVSCQACHIPAYARASATKMAWDWSTAGRLRDGKPFEETDAAGNVTYTSIKGTFTWQSNVTPEYAWFDGTAGHYLLGDRVDARKPVPINTLNGDPGDPDAKIVPVKVHRATQIYDPGTKLLVQPKLYAPAPGQGGFWKDFDWQTAAAEGMKAVNLPYSGTYAFVRTELSLPVNHMVAPKEQALSCNACHARDGSRLAGVGGVYLPGRDRNPAVDGLGAAMLAGVLALVAVHGAARGVAARKRAQR